MSKLLSQLPFLKNRVKFPVTPHIPGGLTTPAQLRAIADTAAAHQADLKIVGNSITLLGVNIADGEKVIAALHVEGESFIAKAVRGVTICPGKPHCPMARQDSTSLGLEMDKLHFGRPLPGKLCIGHSGCPNCCAEVFVKDIGFYADAQGFHLVLGGNGGRQAIVGRETAKNLSADECLQVTASILDFYEQHGQEKERLRQTIERVGLDAFFETVPLASKS